MGQDHGPHCSPLHRNRPIRMDRWGRLVDVGVPQISPRPEGLAAHAEQLLGREPRRHGV
jgi:hypothetical protein